MQENYILTIRTGLYSEEAFDILNEALNNLTSFASAFPFIMPSCDKDSHTFELVIKCKNTADDKHCDINDVKECLMQDIMTFIETTIKPSVVFNPNIFQYCVAWGKFIAWNIFKYKKYTAKMFTWKNDVNQMKWLFNMSDHESQLAFVFLCNELAFTRTEYSANDVFWLLRYFKNDFKLSERNDIMIGMQPNAFESVILQNVVNNAAKLKELFNDLTRLVLYCKENEDISESKEKLLKSIKHELKELKNRYAAIDSMLISSFIERISIYCDLYDKAAKKYYSSKSLRSSIE